jgi:hypothetical protein
VTPKQDDMDSKRIRIDFLTRDECVRQRRMALDLCCNAMLLNGHTSSVAPYPRMKLLWYL